ncbi:hypothetical protein ACFLIN_03820 [Corynebacterium kutscheri]|uniref:hypothetical protein n=1 Tax=Corynebacterium kutscheri TaxID=35755 RepID=UPI0037BE4E70
MNNPINIAFRHINGTSAVEAYGINHPVYGYGETLTEAKADIQQALALLFDQPEGTTYDLNIHHEWCVYEGDGSTPTIWVRTFDDPHNSDRLLLRRKIKDQIQEYLRTNPDYLETFTLGRSVFGDVIAAVCFEDDMLIDALEQVGDLGSIYICTPTDERLVWECLFTDEAEDLPMEVERIADLGLGDCVTVGDLMRRTTQTGRIPKNLLISA